ncbi:hypothetical protein MNBD_NITROSPIRAE01-1040 [hydrothermal vent metagenome]|uniref:Uncharacterized protein n=1 Tax=hydrothermal vent metagenome TaxID=652676 RepID=A0A3B1D2T9_9ZZZZ
MRRIIVQYFSITFQPLGRDVVILNACKKVIVSLMSFR